MFENIKQLFAAKPAPAIINAKEAAWSESSMYVGADFPKYNPDALIGRKGYAIYQKMMTDEQIKAVVRFKRDAITSRQVMFECEHETLSEEDNKFRKELSEHTLDQMSGSFSDALNGIMSSMYNGFSLTEKIYQHIEYKDKTWVGIDRLEVKPCDTFFFYVDQYGVVEKLTQRFDGKEQELDLDKFIHFVQNPDVDKHYGRSELRECYRSWFSKDCVIKFQNIHMERFAAGFVWASPKDGKTLQVGSPEFTSLQSVMSNLQATSAIILPSGINLNVEHPATTDMFERAVAQHDKAIAKALLVPNLLGITEQGNTGSYSQSDTQLEAFFWTLEADSKRLEDTVNEQVFWELGEQNFGDGFYPRLKFKPLSERRKMEIVKTWNTLVTGKAVEATDTDEKYLREVLEFPEKGEPIAKPVPTTAPAAPTTPPNAPQPPEIDPATGKPKEPTLAQIEETIVGRLGISVSAFRKLFWNEDQPRDDNGRFGEGGGGLTPQVEAAWLSKYADINSELRSGGPLSTETKNMVTQLDAAIHAAKPLPEGTVLYRGIGLDKDVADHAYALANAKKGYGISDDGYMSTTTNKDAAYRFATEGNPSETPHLFELRVQDNVKAIPIKSGLDELLIGRNATMKVTGKHTKNGVVYVQANLYYNVKYTRDSRFTDNAAFSRAMKRVDFAVIANKADNSTQDAAHEVAAINSQCVARLVALAEELKLGTAEGQPNDLQKIQYTASEMSQLKAALTKGLKDAWAIGESHAKREVQKAKGAAFAVNDLALQDLAASYLKQKGYTLAGDISAATQKTIRNILMEGVKVSKTAAQTKLEIYKALEADGMLTEEAVVEALGASTVKNAKARIETAIRTTSFEAINEARYSFFSDPAMDGFVEALEYSAILDDRTTEICSQLNGETFGIDDEVWSTFRPPNHFNCRSLLIPVTVRDTWTRSDEPTALPQKGFGFARKCCGGAL